MNFIKKSRIFSKKFRKKIEDLKFNYKPKNEKEEKEIYMVLMQANYLLDYRNEIIDEFENSTFSSEYLKESDDAGYKYVLKDVKKFTQEIESMSKKLI